MTIQASLELDDETWSALVVRSGGLFLLEPDSVQPDVTTRELRKKLSSILSKTPDVEEVIDLFDDVDLRERFSAYEDSGRFLPLLCLLNVPSMKGNQQQSVRCLVVIDGCFLLIAKVFFSGENLSKTLSLAQDRLSQRLSGEGEIFSRVRDSISAVMKEVSRQSTRAPPAMTHEVLLVTNHSKKNVDAPTIKLQNSSLRNAMQQTYLELQQTLTFLYLTTSPASRAKMTGYKIHLQNHELLKLIQQFSATSIYQILTRRRSLSKKIRLETTTLLGLLMEYNEMKAQVATGIKNIELQLSYETVGSDFLRAFRWQEYVDCGEEYKYTDATLTVIDHARSEMESSGMESVTIWAALVTAVAALIVAIVSSIIPRV